MDSTRERIGVMVRKKRNIHRITQEQLAEKINVTTGMIGQIERGETMPSVDTLDALIQQLDIDPRTLFWGTVPDTSDLTELYSIVAAMTREQQHLLLEIAKVIRKNPT